MNIIIIHLLPSPFSLLLEPEQRIDLILLDTGRERHHALAIARAAIGSPARSS